MSGLPNWHPALVHFPIALGVAAAGFEVLGLVAGKGKREWLEPGALLLYAASAVSAIVASVAGQLGANELLAGASSELVAAVGAHSDWAFLTTVSLVALAILRFDYQVRYEQRTDSQNRLRRRVSLVAALVVLACLWQTSSRGGYLVYRLGLGVSGETAPREPPR